MHFKNSLQQPFSFKIQVSLVIQIKKGRDIIYIGMSAIDVKIYTVYVTKMGIFSFEKLQLLLKKKAATLYNQENDKYSHQSNILHLLLQKQELGQPRLNAILIFFLAFVLFLFLFFYFQSQAAFVNCLYVARFTIVHSKTQIKFPLLLLLF